MTTVTGSVEEMAVEGESPFTGTTRRLGRFSLVDRYTAAC